MKIRLIVCIALAAIMLLYLNGCHRESPSPTESGATIETTFPGNESVVTDPVSTDPATTAPDETNPPDVTEPNDPIDPTEPSDPIEPTQPVPPDDPVPPTNPVHRHAYSKVVTPPTCAEDGYTTYLCSCADSYIGDPIPAVGHNWGEWITITIPSEFVMGKQERPCLHCAEVEKQYIPNFNHSYWDDTRTYKTGVMEYDFHQIPEYMLNSKILRALEFTGYDLQYLKDQKLLYHPDYIGHALEMNQLLLREDPILSGIQYNNKGKWGGITKTAVTPKELAATVTGKVPDMTAHLENGMYCTSFIDYFLFAYLPNCEGVDVSAIEATHTMAAKRFGDGTYTYMDLWTEVFEGKGGLVSQGLATHYEINVKLSQKHTAEYNAIWRKIQPGTIIRFGNNVFPYIHYAIYVGTYNNLHYVAHVGNDRGPEIVIAESLGVEASDDPSWPIEFYDLHLESIEKGSIQVVKSDASSGAKLPGAYFTAVDQTTGKEYLIGPTTDEGYAIVHGLPYGTYLVREVTAPGGYATDEKVFVVAVSFNNDLVTVQSFASKRLIGIKTEE